MGRNAEEGPVPVFLEIARAACLSLARRLGPWLLGLAALATIAWCADSGLAHALVSIATLALVGAAIPIVVGTGLRRWLRAGPLGLADRGAGYLATVGYGLGAALVALPFVVGAVGALSGRWNTEDQLLASLALVVAAWLGATAGRLVDGGLAVAMLSWIGAGLVATSAYVVVSLARDAVVLPLGRDIGYSLAEGLLTCVTGLVVTHVLMLGAAYADQRAPTHREP